MSRCVSFYNKWERDPNWCEKCPDSVRKIDKYIDLLETFESKGITREQTIVCLPEGSARPLLAEKNLEIRAKAISHIENTLKRETPNGGKYTQKITSGNVKKIIQNLTHQDKKTAPIPEGKFDVILADPPWRYEFSETQSREIENQYPTMDLEAIKALKIPADANAILFLWATSPKLYEALQVMEAWGFTYRTGFVWDKEVIGMGYWVRVQHEHLLIGVKGSVPAPEPDRRYPSVIRHRREGHSEKPDVVYGMIERMYPNGKYLECFARGTRSRWTSWGNEQ